MNSAEIVRKLGIHSIYCGYFYLIYAIDLAAQNSNYLQAITKWLYPEVASRFNTSCSRVERGIRTVVNFCWQEGNRTFLNEMAGYPLSRKPTSGEFIAILTEYLKQTQNISQI